MSVFIMMLMIICREFVFNGYVDCIIAVNAAALIVLIVQFEPDYMQNKWLTTGLLISSFSTLLLLKNEGIAISFLIAVLSIATAKNMRILPAMSFLFAAALYFFTWKLPLIHAQVSNDLATSSALSHVLNRIGEPSEVLLIISALTKQGRLWVGLLIGVLLLTRPRKEYFLLPLLFIVAYTGLLFLVYLSSPHSISWHLSTSVFRTMLPVKVVCSAAIVCIAAKFLTLSPEKK